MFTVQTKNTHNQFCSANKFKYISQTSSLYFITTKKYGKYKRAKVKILKLGFLMANSVLGQIFRTTSDPNLFLPMTFSDMEKADLVVKKGKWPDLSDWSERIGPV